MAPSAPVREETLARARIVRELGERNPGTYLGHRDGGDEPLDVVLETYAQIDRRVIERVRASACTLRDAAPHPHLVKVIAVDWIGEGLSVVTDFVDGVLLDDVFFGMSLGARLRAVVDVLAALSALHACGVVHGGILRGSSFVETTGRTKLGFAYRQPLCLRKETYAPEALLGDEASIDVRSDVYGAGVMLWEAVTGRVLFGNDAPERVIEQQLAARVEKALPTKSDRWARTLLPVVDRSLSVDPKARFASIAEMAGALRIAVRARLMMHEDVIEEIWPAETTPKVTSGVQPAAAAVPVVAEAAPQVASERKLIVAEARPIESEPAPAPLPIETQPAEEGASSGILPIEPARPRLDAILDAAQLVVPKRRSSLRSILLANVAVVAVVAVVAGVVIRVRAPAPSSLRAEPAEAPPRAHVLAPAVAPPSVPPAVPEPSEKPAGKPAASDHAPSHPAHKTGKHPHARQSYDPSEI